MQFLSTIIFLCLLSPHFTPCYCGRSSAARWKVWQMRHKGGLCSVCNIFRYMQVTLPPPLYVSIYDIEYSKEGCLLPVREEGGSTHVTCREVTCLRPEHIHPVSNVLCTNAVWYSLPLDMFVYVVFNPLISLAVSSISVITRIRIARQGDSSHSSTFLSLRSHQTVPVRTHRPITYVLEIFPRG